MYSNIIVGPQFILTATEPKPSMTLTKQIHIVNNGIKTTYYVHVSMFFCQEITFDYVWKAIFSNNSVIPDLSLYV